MSTKVSAQPTAPTTKSGKKKTSQAAPAETEKLSNGHVDANPVVTVPPGESPELSKTKRKQASKSIGVKISFARMRTRMDQLGINQKLDAMIANIMNKYGIDKKAEKGKYNHSKSVVLSDDQKKALDLETEVYKKGKFRFSKEASLVLSVIAEEIIKQLFTNGMENAMLSHKKIVLKEHITGNGIRDITLFKLIRDLPIMIEALADYDKIVLRKIVADENKEAVKIFKAKLKKEGKLVSKKKNDKKDDKKDKLAAAVPVTIEEQVTEKTDSSEGKTSFKFYISQIAADLTKTHSKFNELKINDKARKWINDLIIEFVEKSMHLVSLVTELMDVKTISDQTVIKTMQLLLVYGKEYTDEITVVDGGSKKNSDGVEEKFTVIEHRSVYADNTYNALELRINEKLKDFKACLLTKKDEAAATAAASATPSPAPATA